MVVRLVTDTDKNMTALAIDLINNNRKRPTRKKHRIPNTIDKKNLSKDTLDVLEAFGLEAPNLLNKYCCDVEDALIEQVDRNSALHKAASFIAWELCEWTGGEEHW